MVLPWETGYEVRKNHSFFNPVVRISIAAVCPRPCSLSLVVEERDPMGGESLFLDQHSTFKPYIECDFAPHQLGTKNPLNSYIFSFHRQPIEGDFHTVIRCDEWDAVVNACFFFACGPPVPWICGASEKAYQLGKQSVGAPTGWKEQIFTY